MTTATPDATLKAGAGCRTVAAVVAELDPTRCDDSIKAIATADDTLRNITGQNAAIRLDAFDKAVRAIRTKQPARQWPACGGMDGTRHALALDRPAGPERWRAVVARAYVLAAFVGYLDDRFHADRDALAPNAKALRHATVTAEKAVAKAIKLAVDLNAMAHRLRSETTAEKFDWIDRIETIGRIETATEMLNDVARDRGTAFLRAGVVKGTPPDVGAVQFPVVGLPPPTRRPNWPRHIFAMRLAEIWAALVGSKPALHAKTMNAGSFAVFLEAAFAVVDWPHGSLAALFKQMMDPKGIAPPERYGYPGQRGDVSAAWREGLTELAEWDAAAILDAPLWTEGLVPDYPHSLDFDFAVACWRAEQPFSGFGPRAERL